MFGSTHERLWLRGILCFSDLKSVFILKVKESADVPSLTISTHHALASTICSNYPCCFTQSTGWVLILFVHPVATMPFFSLFLFYFEDGLHAYSHTSKILNREKSLSYANTHRPHNSHLILPLRHHFYLDLLLLFISGGIKRPLWGPQRSKRCLYMFFFYFPKDDKRRMV